MFVNTFNQNGEQIGKTELPSEIFGVKINSALLAQVAVAQRANARKVIAHTKGRGDVRGGGKKPWRQKGTGRARQGSIRSPIWKGGGVSLGPTSERNFKQKINKKMNRKAVLTALSGKAKDEELILVDAVALQSPKTKEMAKIVEKIVPDSASALLVLDKRDATIERAGRNIPDFHLTDVSSLNVLDVLRHKYIIITKATLRAFEEKYKARAQKHGTT
ncbi:MAG: 50S ribosomal protein L4 [Candidatus Spechtbacteria bacterium]|nr:50S ribosomal protein L4 [Candidatus Spechtbacteria bacterium]